MQKSILFSPSRVELMLILRVCVTVNRNDADRWARRVRDHDRLWQGCAGAGWSHATTDHWCSRYTPTGKKNTTITNHWLCVQPISCGTTKKTLNKNLKITPFSLLLVSTSFYSHKKAFCLSGNTYRLAEYSSGCCALSAGIKSVLSLFASERTSVATVTGPLAISPSVW